MSDGQKLKKPVGMHWKHRIRLGLGPVLARIGRLLGVSWTTMGRSRLGREVLSEQVRHCRDGEVLEPAEKRLDVVFHVMLDGAERGGTISMLLASLLQARGHRDGRGPQVIWETPVERREEMAECLSEDEDVLKVSAL